MKIAAAAALLSIVVLAGACTTKPPDPPDYTGSCRILASQCHPYDTPIGRECHELGHAGDDMKCGPKKAECVAACPPIDGGGHPDDASSDASSEAANPDAGDPCPAFCTCMEATCKAVAGYPYTMPGQCQTACKALTSAELACFPGWCEQAKTSSQTIHLCEHAWGMFGLDECK